MALPTTNITTTMVRNELGAATNNVEQLCTHHTINMWSKRKPVRDFRRVVPENEVGLGDNCGLVLPPWSGDDTEITYYNRPGTWIDKTGRHETPFRLGDFRGYEHIIRERPVSVGNQPPSLLRRIEHISYKAPVSTDPVVSLSDLEGDIRIGALVYGKGSPNSEPRFIGAGTGGSGSTTGGSGTIPLNLHDVEYAYLDIKFGLFEGNLSWTTTFPTAQIKYELPRAYSTESKNWTNIPLKTHGEYIKTFEIVYIKSTNTVEYEIEAFESRSVHIYIKDSSGAIVKKKESIYIEGNTRVKGTISIILPPGNFTAELYIGVPDTPVETRPLPVYGQ